MRKLMFLVAVHFAAATLPATAQYSYRQDYRPDIGGHSRHMHRDWSEQEGRHVHNPCWEWDSGMGWVWICH